MSQGTRLRVEDKAKVIRSDYLGQGQDDLGQGNQN